MSLTINDLLDLIPDPPKKPSGTNSKGTIFRPWVINPVTKHMKNNPLTPKPALPLYVEMSELRQVPTDEMRCRLDVLVSYYKIGYLSNFTLYDAIQGIRGSDIHKRMAAILANNFLDAFREFISFLPSPEVQLLLLQVTTDLYRMGCGYRGIKLTHTP
jgi:hypothetical protein